MYIPPHFHEVDASEIRGIVAFRIAVKRQLAKSKLSQNREERDYLGAIEGLHAAGQGELARRMEQRLRKDR